MKANLRIGNHLRVGAPILFFLITTVCSAEPSVSIRTEAEPREIYIGDPVAYGVVVTVSSDVAFSPPDFPATFGDFDMLAVSTPTISRGSDGKVTTAARAVITTFSTGTVKIPSLPLQFAVIDGSSSTAKTEEIAIQVKSILSEKGDEGNLRPLKGLFNFKSYFWVYMTLLLIALLAGGYFLRRWWRVKKGIETQTPSGPPRPPEELAWQAILTLEDSDLLATGQLKEFYFQLSNIVRDYLERRYGISALDRTTSELMGEFRRLKFSLDLTTLGREFLDNADLVKFAKFQPSEQDVKDDLGRVKHFINITTPKAVEKTGADEVTP